MTAISWQIWAILAAIFAALTAIFAKLGVQTIDSDLATLLRTLVIIVVLGLFLSVKGGWETLAEVTPRAAVFLLLSGLATGASWVCYFRALKLGDAARVAPIDKLSVVLVAILGVVFLGERLSATHWAGVALIALGALLVARA
jgi:bacterial/archaeal transporter family protein